MRTMIISIKVLINGVPMPLRLTIQAFSDGAWRDAATLTVENPERVADGRCLVAYDSDYIIANVDRMEDRCELALSVNLPLNWDHHDVKGYPAFLYDIIPSGAAKDSLESRYGRLKPEGVEMGLYLLERFTPAPIGHLRIKESVEGQLGVSIVSRHSLGPHHEGLAVLNVQGFPIQSQWHLVWPKGKQLSPIAEVFRGHLMGEVKGWMEGR